MYNWRGKHKATNAIYLGDPNGQEGRPFKARFLQAGLVKYDFGVCLLKKETIDKFVNTFVECPVIIDHKDNLTESDRVGTIQKIWFSAEDGWFWCSGGITDDKAVELVEDGYNVSCQYRITDYAENTEGKLHNANPYDKEILNGVFEHLAIVENPRYEDAFIAVNAYIATNQVFNEQDHPRDNEGKFTDGNGINPNYKEELKQVIDKAKNNPDERQKLVIGKVSDKLQQKAKANGLDIAGYSHDLDVSGTRHAIKGHSNEKTEEKRGQIALTDKDFEHIPDIIYNFDDVTFGEEDSKGTPLVKYQKTFQDGTTIYVEEIRSRQKTLTIKTMYKTKKASNSRTFTDLNPQRQEYTSTIIIAHNSQDFNLHKYKPVYDYIQTTKGEPMDKETKSVFESLINALKARNEAEEDEKEKDDEKAANEDDEKKDDDETASNEDDEEKKDYKKLYEELKRKVEAEAKNRCKNEDDEKGYEDLKKDVEKEAENKKAKNSLDALKKVFFEGEEYKPESGYMTQKQGIELGRKLY